MLKNYDSISLSGASFMNTYGESTIYTYIPSAIYGTVIIDQSGSMAILANFPNGEIYLEQVGVAT